MSLLGFHAAALCINVSAVVSRNLKRLLLVIILTQCDATRFCFEIRSVLPSHV